MAEYAHINYIPGLLASGTLTQYSVVKFASTAGRVVAVSATTDVAIGILQNDPTDGEEAQIAGVGSIAIGLAGATDIAVGELLGYNSSAQVVDHTTDGRYMLAQALEASTAANDEIQVQVLGLFSYGG